MADNTATAASLECDNFYQISDDDLDDCEDLPDECLLHESTDGQNASSSSQIGINGHPRGPYERAWTTEATRALIHIRGPMEHRFTEGRQKRTALWLHCTRQLQKMGFRYSAAKVQKKWHNILITYNKNLSKKYVSGYVHWEFFEEMFKYLQGKKADFEVPQQNIKKQQQQQPLHPQPQPTPQIQINTAIANPFNGNYITPKPEVTIIQQQIELDSKSNDDYDEEDSTTMSDMKKPKLEVKDEDDEFPLAIADSNHYTQSMAKVDEVVNDFPRHFGKVENPTSMNPSGWWQDYFERKLQMERDKIDLQKEMHRDLMQFNKMSLLQQEKIERIKIEAINNLTSTLQKLVEVKCKKVN